MSRRGPANHQITRTADRRPYPWTEDPLDASAWTCLCGWDGVRQTAAGIHLAGKAKAAFARLDDAHAFATAMVSHSRSALVRDPAANSTAISLVYSTRHWYANPQLRRLMLPSYDSWGCLAALLDWPAVAAGLEADSFAGEPTDLLILRIACSLAGVVVPLRLSDLLWLGEGDARHVREALEQTGLSFGHDYDEAAAARHRATHPTTSG